MPRKKKAGDSKSVNTLESSAPDTPVRYVLRLFTTGPTPHSARAVANIRALCEKHLEGRYDLDVVDISKNPERAGDSQIIASPTLIKELPLPLRRFIGDMSQTNRILVGLDLAPTVT